MMQQLLATVWRYWSMQQPVCNAHWNVSLKYKVSSKSNASCLVLSARGIRGGWWWYSSRGRTFPPVSHYVLLLGSLAAWHLTWKCIWSKGVELNSSMWEKKNGTHWYSLMLAERKWRPSNGCEHSGVLQQWWQQCEGHAACWMAIYKL